MSPLGRTRVWRGTARSVAIAVDLEAWRHRGQIVAPSGRKRNLHVGQQASPWLGKVRVGAILQGLGLVATGGKEGGAGCQRRGSGASCHLYGAKPRIADPGGREREQVVTTDRYRLSGMIAQASLAWTRALMKPSTHMTAGGRNRSAAEGYGLA